MSSGPTKKHSTGSSKQSSDTLSFLASESPTQAVYSYDLFHVSKDPVSTRRLVPPVINYDSSSDLPKMIRSHQKLPASQTSYDKSFSFIPDNLSLHSLTIVPAAKTVHQQKPHHSTSMTDEAFALDTTRSMISSEDIGGPLVLPAINPANSTSRLRQSPSKGNITSKHASTHRSRSTTTMCQDPQRQHSHTASTPTAGSSQNNIFITDSPPHHPAPASPDAEPEASSLLYANDEETPKSRSGARAGDAHQRHSSSPRNNPKSSYFPDSQSSLLAEHTLSVDNLLRDPEVQALLQLSARFEQDYQRNSSRFNTSQGSRGHSNTGSADAASRGRGAGAGNASSASGALMYDRSSHSRDGYPEQSHSNSSPTQYDTRAETMPSTRTRADTPPSRGLPVLASAGPLPFPEPRFTLTSSLAQVERAMRADELARTGHRKHGGKTARSRENARNPGSDRDTSGVTGRNHDDDDDAEPIALPPHVRRATTNARAPQYRDTAPSFSARTASSTASLRNTAPVAHAETTSHTAAMAASNNLTTTAVGMGSLGLTLVRSPYNLGATVAFAKRGRQNEQLARLDDVDRHKRGADYWLQRSDQGRDYVRSVNAEDKHVKKFTCRGYGRDTPVYLKKGEGERMRTARITGTVAAEDDQRKKEKQDKRSRSSSPGKSQDKKRDKVDGEGERVDSPGDFAGSDRHRGNGDAHDHGETEHGDEHHKDDDEHDEHDSMHDADEDKADGNDQGDAGKEDKSKSKKSRSYFDSRTSAASLRKYMQQLKDRLQQLKDEEAQEEGAITEEEKRWQQRRATEEAESREAAKKKEMASTTRTAKTLEQQRVEREEREKALGEKRNNAMVRSKEAVEKKSKDMQALTANVTAVVAKSTEILTARVDKLRATIAAEDEKQRVKAAKTSVEKRKQAEIDEERSGLIAEIRRLRMDVEQREIRVRQRRVEKERMTRLVHSPRKDEREKARREEIAKELERKEKKKKKKEQERREREKREKEEKEAAERERAAREKGMKEKQQSKSRESQTRERADAAESCRGSTGNARRSAGNARRSSGDVRRGSAAEMGEKNTEDNDDDRHGNSPRDVKVQDRAGEDKDSHGDNADEYDAMDEWQDDDNRDKNDDSRDNRAESSTKPSQGPADEKSPRLAKTDSSKNGARAAPEEDDRSTSMPVKSPQSRNSQNASSAQAPEATQPATDDDYGEDDFEASTLVNPAASSRDNDTDDRGMRNANQDGLDDISDVADDDDLRDEMDDDKNNDAVDKEDSDRGADIDPADDTYGDEGYGDDDFEASMIANNAGNSTSAGKSDDKDNNSPSDSPKAGVAATDSYSHLYADDQPEDALEKDALSPLPRDSDQVDDTRASNHAQSGAYTPTHPDAAYGESAVQRDSDRAVFENSAFGLPSEDTVSDYGASGTNDRAGERRKSLTRTAHDDQWGVLSRSKRGDAVEVDAVHQDAADEDAVNQDWLGGAVGEASEREQPRDEPAGDDDAVGSGARDEYELDDYIDEFED